MSIHVRQVSRSLPLRTLRIALSTRTLLTITREYSACLTVETFNDHKFGSFGWRIQHIRKAGNSGVAYQLVPQSRDAADNDHEHHHSQANAEIELLPSSDKLKNHHRYRLAFWACLIQVSLLFNVRAYTIYIPSNSPISVGLLATKHVVLNNKPSTHQDITCYNRYSPRPDLGT